MKNVVMARLMAEGHVIQKASPSVLLGQSPMQPSENSLFTQSKNACSMLSVAFRSSGLSSVVL